jgi:hypothetical protein
MKDLLIVSAVILAFALAGFYAGRHYQKHTTIILLEEQKWLK